ncbi:MAG: protein disulfide isomerase family protein [Anaplasmataceae bacterium]|nr:protein disulfide isomerase family protein [Candidatus Heimdallarchaeota archaeon]MDH5796052.1 protein disulfide isomerase family protein [Anaplasmataceae bacterium]
MLELIDNTTNTLDSIGSDITQIPHINEEYSKLMDCLDATNAKEGDLTVIEYYLPTCGHCKRYDEAFKAFAELVENRDDINTCQINFAAFEKDEDIMGNVVNNIIHISPEEGGLGFPLTIIYDLYNHAELDYRMGNIAYNGLYNFVNHYKAIDENNPVDPFFGVELSNN